MYLLQFTEIGSSMCDNDINSILKLQAITTKVTEQRKIEGKEHVNVASINNVMWTKHNMLKVPHGIQSKIRHSEAKIQNIDGHNQENANIDTEIKSILMIA